MKNGLLLQGIAFYIQVQYIVKHCFWTGHKGLSIICMIWSLYLVYWWYSLLYHVKHSVHNVRDFWREVITIRLLKPVYGDIINKGYNSVISILAYLKIFITYCLLCQILRHSSYVCKTSNDCKAKTVAFTGIDESHTHSFILFLCAELVILALIKQLRIFFQESKKININFKNC